ncbi:hypothetical protein SISNIDRAFT_106873 [Sistotremastrum niveocremeum HHB9708]|uniref:Complex 1 LYR protein domain-containing protein n=2 Tax=Sistotremastraceae TaxID=3402574 RepID=A0A164TX90_9AGAM|nr:hypothetical protein SISNIDRAFT_106873 [Sistotremastrum niveocremeum HHB9708]KZT41759.1 hypothetical protein SISSUDRAFT_1016860 [Sistotremastrum suecicum HHB10207 ss-3]
MPNNQLRLRALRLYKDLLYLSKDYPDPAYDYSGRIRKMFENNRNLTDAAEVERALKMGEYIKNETLALYSLRKYRHLKRTYYPPDN